MRKRGYLIRFSHTEALLLKKRTLNGHFPRPAETDPYTLIIMFVIALASMSTPVRVTALHVAKKVTSWEIMLLPVFEAETELPGMTYFVM